MAKQTFESAMKQLEQIAQELEAGELSLEYGHEKIRRRDSVVQILHQKTGRNRAADYHPASGFGRIGSGSPF